jgi:hypothetical protein
MGGNVETKAREQVASFRKALEYIDNCGDFTFEKFREADRIAGGTMTESEARSMWSQSEGVMPGDTHSGGPDFLRHTLRTTFVEGIEMFGTLADELGDEPSRKKGLRFWRRSG